MTPPALVRRVAVIGGGVTGLAAAHRLHEMAPTRSPPLEVVLFEADSRPGGVVASVRREGFLLEEGPDSMITDKPWGRQLAERIGIAGRLVGTRSELRRSFVAHGGRLQPTPDGFYLLAPTRILPLLTTRLFSPLGKARMALDLVLPRRRPCGGDESVASFVRRRLGEEVLERMAQPMIAGIYGADPERLSLQATFPRFLQMEREHGSLIRAMMAAGRKRAAAADRETAPGAGAASGPRYGLFVSFDEGLQVLTDSLAARLPAGCIRTNSKVTSLSRAGRSRWLVSTGGPGEEFDAVIVAVHAGDAAQLVRPFDAELAERLASIRYASAATVSLAFRVEDVGHPLDGFGFVVPATSRLSIIGCTFAHRKYPGRAPDGLALMRAFVGEPLADLPGEAIAARVLDDLRPLLGLRGGPRLTHVSVWPRSMPHYHVGHLDLVARIERLTAAHPGLALAGNAYRGVGVPDCIRSGEAAAASLLALPPARG